MLVLLIGYRGTGKTTVATHLAQALGYDAVDADVELERRAGRSIAEIFAEGGEHSFRELESRMLAELLARRHTVVALGGGVVTLAQNRLAIRRTSATVVWLQASPDSIQRRINQDPTTRARRPNLTNQGGRQEIGQLLALREPFYRECATFAVDTENRLAEQVAEEVLDRLRPLEKRSGK